MADQSQQQKKSKYPWGAIFWGTIGVAAGVRALYRPDRALIKDGFASKCAGAVGCDPAMTIESFEGTQAVFAPMRAVVVDTGPNKLYLVPKDEAVLLEFLSDASSFNLFQVAVGDSVGAGQQIAVASRFRFAVYELQRTPDGHAKVGAAIEPASWLAVHGIKISSKQHEASTLWCEGGRKIVTPKAVANCLKLPPPSGYALLPISITTE